MQPGYLYELVFPYEEGQGCKPRPVLIIVLSVDNTIAYGLKVTKSGPTPTFPHRIKVQDYQFAKLDPRSHVQYDIYEPYTNINLTPSAALSKRDFEAIATAFTQYHLT